ncbi:MAG: ribbon-helix-helix protein, CopG family [Terrimicrobiaceae bacterium]
MRTISVKLTDDIEARTEELSKRTGISRSAILRQAITAGLSRVEEGLNSIHPDPEIQPA